MCQSKTQTKLEWMFRQKRASKAASVCKALGWGLLCEDFERQSHLGEDEALVEYTIHITVVLRIHTGAAGNGVLYEN